MDAGFHVFDLEKYRQKYRHFSKCPRVVGSPHPAAPNHLIVFKQGLFSAREELRGVSEAEGPDFHPAPLLCVLQHVALCL